MRSSSMKNGGQTLASLLGVGADVDPASFVDELIEGHAAITDCLSDHGRCAKVRADKVGGIAQAVMRSPAPANAPIERRASIAAGNDDRLTVQQGAHLFQQRAGLAQILDC